jgi:hypothetical protein
MSSINGGERIDAQVAEVTSDVPIACNLSQGELGVREDQIGDLFYQAEQLRELKDGYGFAYQPTEEWAGKVMAFIAVERECCPFFTFEVVFEANYGPLWLVLRGPGDVKQFIEGALLPAQSEGPGEDTSPA